MNYCKCAWLGASRQPPSAAVQQLPHQLCYEDPLACLRAEEKESKLGIRSTEELASSSVRDRYGSISIAGPSVDPVAHKWLGSPATLCS
ncbi:aspergillopepsin-2 [Aspergillus luchuensis]|uniref:Aspergillopepsin-2 n=1 Tax=Aspergillus kawachii TaxID=1069201 RepID=A0A146FHW2_ASPKA|nr:aspergillopepsin-2 [Aspergillus luchuensis]